MTRDQLEAEVRKELTGVAATAATRPDLLTSRMNLAVAVLMIGADQYAGWQSDAPQITARRRNTLANAADLAPCGTYAAFQRHKRRGEQVDAKCGDAAREYDRERKKRKAAA